MLRQWFQLHNEHRDPIDVQTCVMKNLLTAYTDWLKLKDEAIQDYCRKNQLGESERFGGGISCEPLFEGPRRLGYEEIHGLHAYMKTSARDDSEIAPLETVLGWVYEYRVRTNPGVMKEVEIANALIELMSAFATPEARPLPSSVEIGVTPPKPSTSVGGTSTPKIGDIVAGHNGLPARVIHVEPNGDLVLDPMIRLASPSRTLPGASPRRPSSVPTSAPEAPPTAPPVARPTNISGPSTPRRLAPGTPPPQSSGPAVTVDPPIMPGPPPVKEVAHAQEHVTERPAAPTEPENRAVGTAEAGARSEPSSTPPSGRSSGAAAPIFRLGRVPYGNGPLSQLAQRMRLHLGLRRGGNVAVFEFAELPEGFQRMTRRLGGDNVLIEGDRIAFQNMIGSDHSEQLADRLITAGRKAGYQVEVRRIYTEYNPCTDRCLPLIRRKYPSADVSYSFIWERWGRETPDRNDAVDALFKAAGGLRPSGETKGGQR